MGKKKTPLRGSPDDGARTTWHSGSAYALCRNAQELYDFIDEIALAECHDEPGEYPESGESGHAPCLACRAKALVRKVKDCRNGEEK